VAINLYRRHRKDCEACRAENSTSGEFNERSKGWKRCACVIFASGTLAGRFSRKRTGKTTWEEARAWATQLDESGSWDGNVPSPQPEPPPATAGPARVTVVDAISAFITNRESAQIAPATLRKYRTFTKQLAAYADSRGYVMLDQFTPGDADLFYASLKLGPRTKGKRLGVLRAFFRFCAHRKWIAETPVSPDIKPPIGSSKSADKMPFSDEEIERIKAACDNPARPMTQRDRSPGQVGCAYRNDQGEGEWTGEDLKDLIELMLHTGFRISDATLFDMSRLQGNNVMIRAQKNGNHVFAWIPDSVRDRLIQRAKQHGPRPFIVGRSERLETVTNVWRRRLAHAFDAAGPFDQPPTPHRFRHTFARRLLQDGNSIDDVATALGDDPKTVAVHYSAWVPERQHRLTRMFKKSFSSKPKLTGIKGGRG
jgi:integrase